MPLNRTVPPRPRNRFSASSYATLFIFLETALLTTVMLLGLYKPDFSTKMSTATEFIYIVLNAVVYNFFQAAGGTRDPLDTTQMRIDMYFSIVPGLVNIFALLFFAFGGAHVPPKGYSPDDLRLYWVWWGTLFGSSAIVIITDVWYVGTQMFQVTRLTDDATIRIDNS